VSDSILTVTTPAAHSDLITPDDVIADLDIEDDGDHSLFYDDIHAVSAAIVGFLGRDLASATYSEQFRLAAARDALLLSRIPVDTITSVTEAGTVLTGSDYELDAKSGLLYRLSSDTRSCWPAAKIVVAYTAGYELPGDQGFQKGKEGSLPADIEKAAVIACRALYNARGNDPMIKREVIPGVAEEERWVGTDPGQGDSGLPVDAERLLERYRDIRVG